MKYCIEYSTKFKYLEEVEEILITFNHQDTALPTFLEKYSSKTIVIDTTYMEDFTKKDIDFFKELYLKYPNFKLKISFSYAEKVSLLESVPYFFDIFVAGWQELHAVAKYNPCDMYISGILGFEVECVAKVLYEKNIKIRAIPNLAQSADKDFESYLKFFIRPEDVNIYESYIDIFEFAYETDKKQTYIYYEIYEKTKEWTEDLNTLIYHCPDASFNNKNILPTFAERRKQCGQKCLKGNSCSFCEKVFNLANGLKEKSLTIHFD